MDITWVFFDIGSTLVDETEAYNHRIRDMISGTDITFKAFDKKRIELTRSGYDGNSQAIKFFGLAKTPWHSEDEKLFADTKQTLDYLKRCKYKLGVIANQTLGVSERLKNWGILDCFDVVASSAELGVSKPDAKIFYKALEMADYRAEKAVMVGDRLDNDIIPAKAIGMKTIWIRSGLAKYQDTMFAESIADYVVDTLSDVKNIFMQRDKKETENLMFNTLTKYKML